jgi:superfamily I DNA and/or RNA helicase
LPNTGFVNYLEAQAVVRELEALASCGESDGQPMSRLAVLALYPAQAELIRRMIRQSPRLAARGPEVEVTVPGAFRQRESPVVLVSLTRSHSHRAVSFGEGPQTLALALTRARERLIIFGDPGTLARRGQWEGPLDQLDETTAGLERRWVTRLLAHVPGQGRHPEVIRPGSP